METRSLQKTEKEEVTLSRLGIGHTRTTDSYLKQSSNQRIMHTRPNSPCNTFSLKVPMLEKHFIVQRIWRCDSPHPPKNQMNNVMSYLKTVNLYRNIDRNFQKDQISSKMFSLPEILQQNLIFSTRCSTTRKTNNFFLQDDSLQINFRRCQTLSKKRFSTNKFQHYKPFLFPPY